MARRLALTVGLLVALGPVAGVHAQDGGRTAPPRAGDTVLTCADGGWDVAGGTCAGRGGIVGSQVVGSGVGPSNQSFQVQPNFLFPDGGNPAPRRCGWANPCDGGSGE